MWDTGFQLINYVSSCPILTLTSSAFRGMTMCITLVRSMLPREEDVYNLCLCRSRRAAEKRMSRGCV